MIDVCCGRRNFLSVIRANTPVLCLSPVRPRKMFQCGMLERDRRALRKRSTVLCKQLVVDEHFIQYLQADEILTDVMAEGILVCTYYTIFRQLGLES